MTQQITVWGKTGSSELTQRADLLSYNLQVRWRARRWRESEVELPSGERVTIDTFVGQNFQRPRQFHPEYALAVELLIANAVMGAKSRGFRVASVELGIWPYRTITTLGKRITKIGLSEPMLREDGRTETYTAFQWVDPDGEGVLLTPWANGDQLIRLKDVRGYYVVPVDERTADASRCPQAHGWRAVHSYKPLVFGNIEWEAVPLLEAGDLMVEQLDCQMCLFLFPVKPWSFEEDVPSQKRVCPPCKVELERVRGEAKAHGWDFDQRRPLPPPRRLVKRLVNPATCDHQWGRQMAGTSNAAVSPEKRETEGMQVQHLCTICGTPDPKHHTNIKG